MSSGTGPSSPGGGSADPDLWQRRVTRWASALAVLFLGLLTAAVLAWREGSLAGNLVNTVVAAANVAFVIFTWAVFKAGQEQIAQMRREYTHAEQVYEEAVRARLDQTGPRVSVSFDSWDAALEKDDQGNHLQPGAVVADGQRVRVRTLWLVKNWGPEPVIVTRRDMADPGCPHGRRVLPGARTSLTFERQGTVADWKLADGSWECDIEVIAEDLSGAVRDRHSWEGTLRLFVEVQDGVRLVAPDISHDAVARRERSYPDRPPSPLRSRSVRIP
ncbi:hypothetical protein [Streptomyces neyagawaensis]|uniref:hypothetical protein n=1 Tax=Streptomyces neyagawaensis TaxID=42238 RepID=UPI0006E33E9E|nr:hypothetical protein [Streptomyces neyagawaensis]MCL6737633.1 hypothetical protein [Streptomyces neyagawaensis]MDE1682995.1 hypothetical protein [Streptomyces neyagawaensis]